MFVAFVALTAGCTRASSRELRRRHLYRPGPSILRRRRRGRGQPLTCIAVSCTPGAFAACRGDSELTCTASVPTTTPHNVSTACDQGTGCRLCEPNQTVCTNGKAQTCDARRHGHFIRIVPLGCFEDQPRCREIDPSNGLASYMDMAATGPDLVSRERTLSPRAVSS